jgi:hypothetical protein
MNTGITGTSVIGIVRMNGEVVAVTGTSGIFTSINNGLTWNPNPNSLKDALYYTYHTDTTTFRLGTNVGIYLSIDGGLTWNSDTAGLGTQAINAIVKHSSMFCSTNKGVYEYVGAKWTARVSGAAEECFRKYPLLIGECVVSPPWLIPASSGPSIRDLHGAMPETEFHRPHK